MLLTRPWSALTSCSYLHLGRARGDIWLTCNVYRLSRYIVINPGTDRQKETSYWETRGTRYNNNSVGLFTTLYINRGQCCLYLETLHKFVTLWLSEWEQLLLVNCESSVIIQSIHLNREISLCSELFHQWPHDLHIFCSEISDCQWIVNLILR